MTPFDRWHRVMQAPNLSPPEKATLTALACFAGEDGSGASPAIATLAEYTSLTERTIYRALDGLTDCGLVVVERRPNLPSLYTVRWSKIPERRSKGVRRVKAHAPDRESPPDLTESQGVTVRQGVTESHPVPDRESPPDLTESHLRGDRQSPKGASEGARRKEPGEGALSDPPYPPDASEAFDPQWGDLQNGETYIPPQPSTPAPSGDLTRGPAETTPAKRLDLRGAPRADQEIPCSTPPLIPAASTSTTTAPASSTAPRPTTAPVSSTESYGTSTPTAMTAARPSPGSTAGAASSATSPPATETPGRRLNGTPGAETSPLASRMTSPPASTAPEASRTSPTSKDATSTPKSAPGASPAGFRGGLEDARGAVSSFPEPIWVNGREVPGDLSGLFYGFNAGRFWGHDKVILALAGIGVETTADVLPLTVSGLKKTSGFGGAESKIPDRIAAFLNEKWGISLAEMPVPRVAPGAGRRGPPGIWDQKPSRVIIDVSPSGAMLPIHSPRPRLEL